MEEKPLFSIILVIEKASSHLIGLTLMNLAEQTEKNFELILIINQKIEDRCGIIDSYRGNIHRVYSSLSSSLAFMKNKGVQISSGKYLHFMMPGGYFLSNTTLKDLEEATKENPEIITAGYIDRRSLEKPDFHLESFTLKHLERGSIPLHLGSCYLRRDIFDKVGWFELKFRRQSGYDFLCRVLSHPNVSPRHIERVFSDSFTARRTPKEIIGEATETLAIIRQYFGFRRAFFSWVWQNYLAFIKWWLKTLQKAFWHPSS